MSAATSTTGWRAAGANRRDLNYIARGGGGGGGRVPLFMGTAPLLFIKGCQYQLLLYLTHLEFMDGELARFLAVGAGERGRCC